MAKTIRKKTYFTFTTVGAVVLLLLVLFAAFEIP